MLRVGIEGEGRLTVTENDTAAAVGSGSLRVFATPAMAALMEKTALDSVAATPVGLEVVCRSTLTAVDGRRLVFSLSVEDACGPVGEGTHERFIVAAAKFQSKADAKAGR